MTAFRLIINFRTNDVNVSNINGLRGILQTRSQYAAKFKVSVYSEHGEKRNIVKNLKNPHFHFESGLFLLFAVRLFLSLTFFFSRSLFILHVL